jgi:hypothetical protein
MGPHGEDVSLSAQEQRTLDGIAWRLAADDPALAQHFRSGRSREASWLCVATVLLFSGAVVMVAALAVALIVAIVGAVAYAAGLWIAAVRLAPNVREKIEQRARHGA